MALTGVLRPGHVQLRVLDLPAAVRHYSEVLGLWEAGIDAQGRAYFKAWDEHDHHSVVLRDVGADLNLTHRADPILTRGWMPTA